LTTNTLFLYVEKKKQLAKKGQEKLGAALRTTRLEGFFYGCLGKGVMPATGSRDVKVRFKKPT
jgi:hypothetical protein